MKKKPIVELPGKNDAYDDDNIPEIDLPGKNHENIEDDGYPHQDASDEV